MTSRDDVELKVVAKARNTIEAELFVGILKAADIPAMVDGRYLQDEFAMPQKMLGLEGIKVRVRKEDLAEARLALDAAREAGQALDSEPETDET